MAASLHAVHPAAPRRPNPSRATVVQPPSPHAHVTQDFGKPGNLAAELGIPFCSMDASRRYRTGAGGTGGEHTESLGGSKKLAAVEGNVRELRLLL